ncbi:hypothetical protein L9F63_019189 [Diploptera punctata]|uniref:Uncharacterized protein n=1 Tax=Diploptera punctata TaxID=6984 RepID=A0AAD7ZUQ7_DIPPU|nr:hypothetical protein L9F63_019189 [Diploptera punctata]
MGGTSYNLFCIHCNQLICEVAKWKVNKKGKIAIPDIINVTTRDAEDAVNKDLLCYCGECIGEALQMKTCWKYFLNSAKITRSVIHNSDKMTDKQSSSSRKLTSNKETDKKSSLCDCNKSAEILEMKSRFENLEKQMNSMNEEYINKFKDMSKMLILYKLEITRLQEVIWSLHPEFDLNAAFTVDTSNISLALNNC